MDNLITIAVIAVFAAVTLWAWRQYRRAPKYTGAQDHNTLIGLTAVAETDINPRGSVHLIGESWSAVSVDTAPIAKGDNVIVLEVDGLALKVFKADDDPSHQPLGERQ